MSLLFIPAGAGILAFWPLLAERPLAMAAVLLLSTLSTLLISALTLTLLLRHQRSRKAKP
jgi:holin-like protein